MKNNTWALERLVSIINNKDKIIKSTCIEICKLRGFIPDDTTVNKIRMEFENKEEK